MRVIHLIGGGDTGGAKTHVLNLLKELNESIEVRLVSFRQGDFSEEARQMGIPVEVIDTGNIRKAVQQLKEILSQWPVDVIHCHGARGNLMGKLVQKYAGAPVITTVHSDYRRDYVGRPAARLFYGTTNTVALRHIKYFIAVAEPMAELLIRRGFPADSIYTMYNSIDFRHPVDCVPREEFLRSLGLDVQEGDVVAGIAARLTPVKDHPTLLKALAKACEKAPQLKLVIAGDGEDKEKLLQLTRELGVEDRVCFAGWVKDTDSFFHAIDINLLTSITEGFPYVLPEGARMRCATISSNVGGVPVIIEDGRTGLLFEPGDVDALAKHLAALAGDREYREALGNRLYDKAEREFSLDHMVEQQLEIYQDVLAREARKRQVGKGRDGVVICGAYGHGNAGDDAILKSIIRSVRELDEHMPVTVLAKDALNVKTQYRVDSVNLLNIFRITAVMCKTRLYINGGGSLIQNATSQRSLMYYLFTLWLAKLLGNKVDMYGCGIGPVMGAGSVRLVAHVLNHSVDSITLRERDSMETLARFSIDKPRIRLSSDPALALPPASSQDAELFLRQHGLEPEGKYICFMLRTWYGSDKKAEALAQCAGYAFEKYGLTPVFLALNVVHDWKAADQVIPHLSCPYHRIDDSVEPELLIALLSYMDVVVSMRLHGLILSSLSGVPLMGVSYDPKINSFLKYLGAGSTVDLADVTAEGLTAQLDEAVSLIPHREELARRAGELKARERENIEAVRQLLEL